MRAPARPRIGVLGPRLLAAHRPTYLPLWQITVKSVEGRKALSFSVRGFAVPAYPRSKASEVIKRMLMTRCKGTGVSSQTVRDTFKTQDAEFK